MIRSLRRSIPWPALALAAVLSGSPLVRAADAELPEQAAEALHRAVVFSRDNVASHGGYVYHYSLDLQERWGEGVATADQIWVQPPATPTVGMAFLKAHAVTGKREYLDAATAAAEALIYGQLQSGGWTNSVDFNPRGNHVALYRNGKGKGKNNSTLDDGISQSAIRFLVRADKAHDFQHKAIHEAAGIALDALLKAQFANGAFPQVWTGPVPEEPVKPASFPEYDWRTEGRVRNYWDMYTLNDNIAGFVTAALLDAWRVYDDDKYKAAVLKLGDFLLLAQLPDPQPAWAQQYDYEMRPIWARRFEPAAVTSSESQDVLESLLKIHAISGDEKYLAPFPRALAYLKKSQLPDGRLSRYYELRTNKPLYMERTGDRYELTYDDSNLPDHYGWKIESRLEAIERAYQQTKSRSRATSQNPPGERGGVSPPVASPVLSPPPSRAEQERQVRQVIKDLDSEGRWVSTHAGERLVGQPKFKPGFRYLSSGVFVRNVEVLCDYLAQSKEVAASVKSSLETDGEQIRQLAFDGDPASCFVSKGAPKPDDHFTLIFERPVMIRSLVVLTGRPDGQDALVSGTVLVSADGAAFEAAATFVNGVARGTPCRAVKAVRIRPGEPAEHPLVIREIEIESSPRVAVFRYPVEFVLDVRDAPEMQAWAEEAAEICTRAYPMINDELRSDGFRPARVIHMRLANDYRGVAATSGNRIVGAVKFFKEHPDDFGAMVHETAHVVQAYGRRRGNGERNPGWLVEGVADYVRFIKHEPENIGRFDKARARYDASYRVSARFLNYLAETYDGQIVRKLNEAMRKGEYREALFEELTGKPLGQLGDEWKASLAG
jgi:PelA/Pel-15E family pectate lyase